MVIVLAVCPMTGACHAPVDSKQGSTCKVADRRGLDLVGEWLRREPWIRAAL